MKLFLIALFFLILSQPSFAQQKELNQFNSERQQISKKGVTVIGSWAAANIIYAVISAGNAHGNVKYFHEMNAIFNGVTLAIVGLGYFTAKKEGELSLADSYSKQQGIDKLFLFNAGLDVAYIAGGAYLQERAKTSVKNQQKFQGYGRSIMLQGGALLLFDGIMFGIHNCHGKKLHALTNKITLGNTENGVGLVMKL